MLKKLFQFIPLFLFSLSALAVNGVVTDRQATALNQSDTNNQIDGWLDKMSQAMTQQNFQGTLIIRQEDKLQSIRVKQGVTANGGWQTLEALTGEDQTIFRQNGRVTTIFPGKKLVTISNNSPGNADKGPLHPALPENRRIIKKYYSLKLNGHDRIANKTTQIIKMIPRDKLRYGYTFWLDKKSGLLLKCDLMDEKGQVLEQLMYSEVELLTEAPANHINTKKLEQFRKINLTDKADVKANNWQAKQLPEGFTLTRSVKAFDQIQKAPYYHLVYSDGMASVSVFIEQRHKADEPVMGKSSMGAVNAYSSFMNNVYVTAIGEVPVSTVRMIAQSMQPVK